ncbi:L-ectoine synthase, partial [Streptomyces caelestis]
RHTLKVKEDFHCICVFNPPVTGREDHDENGVYPPPEPEAWGDPQRTEEA